MLGRIHYTELCIFFTVNYRQCKFQLTKLCHFSSTKICIFQKYFLHGLIIFSIPKEQFIRSTVRDCNRSYQ